MSDIHVRRLSSGDSPWKRRDDAAAYLRIALRLLDEYLRAGELPYCKLGRVTLIHVDDLDAFVRKHTASAEADR